MVKILDSSEKRIIFLDVDGTLINYDLKLPDSAKEAVEKARSRGNQVYLCTGCSPSEIRARGIDIELDGIISGNGSYIESKGEVIFYKTMTLQQVDHIIDWCTKRDLCFHFETNSGMFACKGYERDARKAEFQYRFGKDAIMPSDYKWEPDSDMFLNEDMRRTDVNKADFIMHSFKDHLDSIEEFPDLQPGYWGGQGEMAIFGDLGIKGVSKKRGVEMLLEHIGADRKDTMGFGDAKSDLPMFEAVNIKVAMGNGGYECKKAADYVTDDVNDNGLYNAFRHFGLI